MVLSSTNTTTRTVPNCSNFRTSHLESRRRTATDIKETTDGFRNFPGALEHTVVTSRELMTKATRLLLLTSLTASFQRPSLASNAAIEGCSRERKERVLQQWADEIKNLAKTAKTPPPNLVSDDGDCVEHCRAAACWNRQCPKPA